MKTSLRKIQNNRRITSSIKKIKRTINVIKQINAILYSMTIILPHQPTAVLASPLAVIADGGVRQHVPLNSL